MLNRIKEKKGYFILGAIVVVALLFFIFPMLAAPQNKTSILEINSKIPCPGHATLVSGYIQELNGIKKVEYYQPENFKIYYDTSLVSKEEILNLEILKEFTTTIVSEK